MIVTTKSKGSNHHPMRKDKYKVRNWRKYNNGLKQRGSLNLWISKDLSESWLWSGDSKPGSQYLYSNTAIEFCLTISKVYGLALRQTEGFISSFFEQMAWRLKVPVYTTLCRRSKGISINLRSKHRHITDIVLDSTGLKVYGEGEWKIRKHGKSKHRTWMKLHLAIDADSQEIKAVKLTTNSVTDRAAAPALIESIAGKINSVKADGGYDKDLFRMLLGSKKIKQIIPPQSNAVIDKSGSAYLTERNEAIEMIKKIGRKEWKITMGYHDRSRIETTMFRYKKIIGDKLSARIVSHQETEVAIGCKILNMMLQVAKPESYKVV